MLLLIIGFFVGQRRIYKARHGHIAKAQPEGDQLALKFVEERSHGGYRDQGKTISTVYLPMPSSFDVEERRREQVVIYSDDPRRAIILGALHLEIDANGIITQRASVTSRPFGVTKLLAIAIAPYLVFSFLLLTYFVSNL
jgi:hypothetical protein